MPRFKKLNTTKNKKLTKNKLNRYKEKVSFDLKTPNGEKIIFSDNLKHKPIIIKEGDKE